MGKNNRHQKNLKSERAKVKLKTKKAKVLPKGQNITDTTFKVKKILIRDQLKQHEESEILSRRKLNVKDLLTRLQHHNSTMRQDAIRELKDILIQHPIEILGAHLNSLLQGVSSLTLDKEKDIRRDTLKVLGLILGPISKDQLAPFSDILISYLCCAMTHIVPNIKEDSLNFLDVLVHNCSNLIAKNSRKILPHFLDMISKHSHTQTARQLVVTLNSKNTSIKWRIKVFEKLSSILNSIINESKSQKGYNKNSNCQEIVVDDKKIYTPLIQGCRLAFCRIDLEKENMANLAVQESRELEEFNKYVAILMPLMLESWLEVRPKQNFNSNEVPQISLEAANLLKVIASVMQYIVEYIETMEQANGPSADLFRRTFEEIFTNYLMTNFPYNITKSMERTRRRQADFEKGEINDNCLVQNFLLCYIYMWMISAGDGKKLSDDNKEFCERILEFINERLNNWSNSDMSSLPQLIKLLRVVFMKSSKILYKSGISCGATLKAVIAASRQQKRELHTQLFAILTEIVLDDSLRELYSEPAFKEFVKSLPDLLLRANIHYNTIYLLNRVVLQYRNWIREDLIEKQQSILDNAKKIQIIGTADEKSSRLLICNLFYSLDEQIYF